MPYLLRDIYGQEFPVTGVIQIGRDASCQILLSDPQASRLHATVWEEGGRLLLRDENSRNGTFVNGHRVRSATLQPGDHIRIGDTNLAAAAYPGGMPIPVNLQMAQGQAPSQTQTLTTGSITRGLTRPQTITLIGAGILLVCVILAGAMILTYPYFRNTLAFLPQNAATPETTSFGNVAASEAAPSGNEVVVIATSQEQKILSPAEYQATTEELAQSIEALNLVELQFIQDSRAVTFSQPGIVLASFEMRATSQSLDGDLCQAAGQAMDTGRLAESLMLTAATQAEGSQMAKITAGQYASIARLAYALVIDAQNMRQGLQTGKVTPAKAAGQIAEYGAQLWNPAVKKAGTRENPFLSYVENSDNIMPVQFLNDNAIAAVMAQSKLDSERLNWLATSTEEVIRTIDLPRFSVDTNIMDPEVLQALTTAAGQADADQARQAAAFKLQSLVSPNKQDQSNFLSTNLDVPVYKGVSMAGKKMIQAMDYPSYSQGQATSEQITTAQGLVSTAIELQGENPPVIGLSEPVAPRSAGINISIDSVEEKRRWSEGPDSNMIGVVLYMHVSWRVYGYKNPLFHIYCTGGGSSDVTTMLGSTIIEADTYATFPPGKAEVTCRATQGNSLISEAAIGALIRLSPPENAAVPEPNKDPNEKAPEPKPQEESNETRKLGTEVAAQKTAEFLAAVTEIARQTEAASASGVHALTGTFSMTEEGQGCMPGALSSGPFKIIADFGNNSVSGYFSGSGHRTNSGVVCGGITFDMTCSISYSGSFGNGTIDPASGVLTVSHSSVSGSMDCQFEHCIQNGEKIDCPQSSGKSPYEGSPVITGRIDKNSLSGNGTISVCKACRGDWSAGQ